MHSSRKRHDKFSELWSARKLWCGCQKVDGVRCAQAKWRWWGWWLKQKKFMAWTATGVTWCLRMRQITLEWTPSFLWTHDSVGSPFAAAAAHNSNSKYANSNEKSFPAQFRLVSFHRFAQHVQKCSIKLLMWRSSICKLAIRVWTRKRG